MNFRGWSRVFPPAFCALALAGMCRAGILTQSGDVSVGTSSSASSICDAPPSQPTPPNAYGNNCTSADGHTVGTFITSADYGVLKAFASYTSTDELSPYVNAVAVAGYTDFISSLYHQGNAPATFTVTLAVTGPGLAGANAGMDLFFYSDTEVNPNVPCDDSVQVCPPPIPSGAHYTSGAGIYTYTVPWAAHMIIQSTLRVNAGFDNVVAGPWSGSGRADYFSTARVQSIVFRDEFGNDVSSEVELDSAGHYQIGLGDTVPEPSTWTLGVFALAAMATARVRHSRNRN